MATAVSYKLSDLIKEAIGKKKRSDNINELLIDVLEREIEWQHASHTALDEFKKNYKKLIDQHCPYVRGEKNEYGV